VRTHPDLYKGYLREAKQNIITFLVENRYFHHNDDGMSAPRRSITEGVLPLSTAAFSWRIDPEFQLSCHLRSRGLRAVSTYLRRLKYPYHFTTSYMQAVGHRCMLRTCSPSDGTGLAAQARYLLQRFEHACR
jgi:hypothetical protein